MVIETEEERKTALVHLVALRRTAAELGMHSIEVALSEWEKAGAAQEALPEVLRRAAVLARLFGALGV